MKERIKPKTIFKLGHPENLIVFHAESLEDEIRFYFNNTQYVSARYNYNGTCSINYEEEKIEVNERKSKITLSIIKENWKDFLMSILLSSIIVISISITLVILAIAINNTLIYFLLINFIFSSLKVIVVIRQYKNTPPALKSKHSAEHMMVNFLDKNKRLPQNMSEIKSTTRFNDNCGSGKMTLEYARDFVHNTVTAVLAIIIGNFITQNWKNGLHLYIFIVIYIAIGSIVEVLIRKYNKLYFIIKPMQKLLSNIIQYSNTTKKVEDNDIILAFCAAKEWLKIVYPEFYNDKDEDKFWLSVATSQDNSSIG